MHAFFENRAERFDTHTSRGLSYPLHLHPHLELFFMLSGETTVTIRGQAQTLTPGSLAVIFPNQIHSYRAHSAESRATLVICELARTGGYVDLLLRSHPKNPFLKPELLHPNVAFAIGEMTAEHRGKENGRSESAKECVTTHLPNQLALKMDGAGASGPYPAVAGSR